MTSFRRKCKNDSDLFCYICGEMTASKYRRKITDRIKKLYLAYFGCAVADQDKNWALHVCCLDCSNRLNKWFAGGKPTLLFAVPMVWREQKDHLFLPHGHSRISPQNQKEDAIPKFAICNSPSSTF